MPVSNKRKIGKSKYGKGKKFKKYKRMSVPNDSKPVICYAPTVCPDIMRVRLCYNERITSAGGGTVPIVDFVFRGNSPFDPQFALGGGQPMGFDQWAAFYRKYRVIASKLVVKYSNNAAIEAFGYVSAANTSAAYTDRSAMNERVYTKTVNIGTDTVQGVGEIEYYMPTNVIRGGPSDLVRYNPNLSALTTANCNEQWYWHVGAYGVGASVNNYDVNCDVSVYYYVEFFDRETLGRS